MSLRLQPVYKTKKYTSSEYLEISSLTRVREEMKKNLIKNNFAY